ncbi:MAG: hypothetical protein IJY39_14080 [Clostridia bacterium]|nr:hypothetical protein [Clostridia bacterium]
MKAYLKIISLILALLIVLSCFVACDNSDTQETVQESSEATTVDTSTEAKTELETTFFPDIKKNDYNDSFFITIHTDSNPIDFYWVEESSNDVLSQAIYNRQVKVKDYLGVEILATPVGNSSSYIEPFKTAVKNKDGSVDTLLTHVYHGIDGFVTENYLTDFKNIEGLNLNADYWNSSVMESISINDRMYLGFSDFNILYTHVVAFNKDMMAKYEDSMEESVYEMVENYHWTLDQMISIANMVYVDETSDGKTKDDTFGIVGLHDIAFCGFLHSSNINIIEINAAGDYELSVFNEVNKAKTTDVIEKIGNLVKSDCAWFWKMRSGNDVNFYAGKALLSLSPTNHLPGYLNYDINFGVLPYPMYEEAQKDVGYRSLQWGGYLCVPSYMRDPALIGDTLEMMTFYSAEVNNAFYNKLLGKQVADSPIDQKMLEIVWDGLCSDIAQTYYSSMTDTQILYVVPYLTFENSTQNIGSFIASKESTVNKKLKKLMTLASKLP